MSTTAYLSSSDLTALGVVHTTAPDCCARTILACKRLTVCGVGHNSQLERAIGPAVLTTISVSCSVPLVCGVGRSSQPQKSARHCVPVVLTI